ncbi:hypothetical protein PYW08_006070 [Mythimna loreyi]|uniref:Uncharacterized protein n=1 Tax=Mythimna loreyi TaxID=667449 RepID=A0ACC2QM30_9NEOP|nr:hypothetical protein PYW08_006070 [Mythimna loreyi]
MQSESSSSIRNLIGVTNKNLRALLTLGQDAEFSLQDTLIIHIMSEKLDDLTRRQWEEHRNNFNNPPSLDSFVNFLSNRADYSNKDQQLEPNQYKKKRRRGRRGPQAVQRTAALDTGFHGHRRDGRYLI